MLIQVNQYSWLPISVTKGLTVLPSLILEEPAQQRYGGYFRHGSNNLVVVQNEYFESTIAHELCHFIQEYTGTLPEGGSELDFSISYDSMIRKYFRTYKCEMEALLFEVKHCKNELNEWWLRKLVLE